MSAREIKVVKDIDALSAHAANLFVDVGRESIALNGTFDVSLAGGSTPRNLYRLLASERHRHELDWKRLSFFFGDERNVPDDSLDSNYLMASETLLAPLDLASNQVHRWRTELSSVDEVVRNYESELIEHFKRSKRGFDLVLLGLGTDAHTASLFPHTAALRETERLAVANWVEKLNDYRLTTTFPVINNALNVMFLVSGSEKAEAVFNVLEGEFRPDNYPAQMVNPMNGNLFWLLDEAAASKLKRLDST